MKIQIAFLTATTLLIGCSSLTKTNTVTRIVEVEAPQPIKTVQATSFSSNADPKQAAIVCETSDMRARALDYDNSNDIVRIMSVQDSNGGSQLLSEVEVDCRDYYLRKSLSPTNSNVIQTSSQPIETIEPVKVIRSAPPKVEDKHYTYIVQRGDTVWQIAREHCTTVKAISRLNGIGNGKLIGINQRLKMPLEGCN